MTPFNKKDNIIIKIIAKKST